jgi:hypothetical protein
VDADGDKEADVDGGGASLAPTEYVPFNGLDNPAISELLFDKYDVSSAAS